MKVYIAGKYGRRHEFVYVANALKAHGHENTARWVNGDEEGQGAAAAAQMDVDDVLRADAILFIGQPKGSANTGGGRWFELGLAYANKKRCLAVLDGGSETVFTALPEIKCFDSVEAALVALEV
jgi:nucleoside 2-deoxyribosyltransferase